MKRGCLLITKESTYSGHLQGIALCIFNVFTGCPMTAPNRFLWISMITQSHMGHGSHSHSIIEGIMGGTVVPSAKYVNDQHHNGQCPLYAGMTTNLRVNEPGLQRILVYNRFLGLDLKYIDIMKLVITKLGYNIIWIHRTFSSIPRAFFVKTVYWIATASAQGHDKCVP